MSSAAPGGTREQGRSEYGVALFLGALGLLVIVQALAPAGEPDRPRAGRPGRRPDRRRQPAGRRRRLPRPRRRPAVAAASRRAARTSTSPAAPTGAPSLLLAAAFLANALLIEPLGWPFSGAILFWGSAFALGSRHYVRDAVIALVLSFGSWYLFALGLGMVLPVGILKGIL